MAKYLKLGEKATIFFDPSSQICISNNEVIELEMIPKNKKITTALSQGHLVRSDKTEYDAYKTGSPVIAASAAVKTSQEQEDINDVLIDLTDEGFIEKVRGAGFTKKHQKMILEQSSREDQIKMYRKLEKSYE